MHFLKRSVEGGDLCAIFVHAGAGYHSTHNEKNHLRACNDAARCAMAILKNGGTAVEAVEMAVRSLEDQEITNAGYGSNLTMDGAVECDACIVDHFGRSGAVGSITKVKNPVVVARHVLDASILPLSLSRVPPNFLVGEGAVDFAEAHGVNILPDDFLVADGARSRWRTWMRDLQKVEAETLRMSTGHHPANLHSAPATPTVSVPQPSHASSQNDPMYQSSNSQTLTAQHRPSTNAREPEGLFDEDDSTTDDHLAFVASARKRQRTSTTDGTQDSDDCVSPPNMQRVYRPPSAEHAMSIRSAFPVDPQDRITDTVGAIAVDCLGRIAAASSSGGIGMKHKGRCGPAALVGISTAVIPADPDDPDESAVATVTSGTGEHMATTAAAHIAADRILTCSRKTVGGKLESCTEDEAMESMIRNDFMKHPGVRYSPCTGAIGILAVKKTKQGIYFYFGHNTDSFALASMHSEERKPVCVMSRSRETGMIAQGARNCRSKRAKS